MKINKIHLCSLLGLLLAPALHGVSLGVVIFCKTKGFITMQEKGNQVIYKQNVEGTDHELVVVFSKKNTTASAQLTRKNKPFYTFDSSTSRNIYDEIKQEIKKQK